MLNITLLEKSNSKNTVVLFEKSNPYSMCRGLGGLGGFVGGHPCVQVRHTPLWVDAIRKKKDLGHRMLGED